MSYAALVLGESGSGKTCSLRNFDPAKVLLIQPVRKPLPFPSKDWKEMDKDHRDGSIYVSDRPDYILRAVANSTREVVIIDDFQYVLANMYMAKRDVKSFEKFTEIGGAGFDICTIASKLQAYKRVYVLAHTTTDDQGRTHIKTLGKMLDEKIVLEGLFTTVLRTHVDAGRYYFSTQTNGYDTVKSPMGMFSDSLIENDLAAVDRRICEYYGIPLTGTEDTLKEVES